MGNPWSRVAVAALALVIAMLPPARSEEPPRSGRTASPAATPRSYEVDLDASQVYVKVGASGRIGHDHAVLGKLESGTIALGSAGSLVIDMRTFATDSPEARRYVGLEGAVSDSDRQKINATMLGPEVLDVARYPRASYAIASVVPAEGQPAGEAGRYRLDGSLTLHGTTRKLPITAQVDRTASVGVLRMRCAFAIDQTDFGITPYSTLAGIVGVANRLEIRGDLLLRPSPR